MNVFEICYEQFPEYFSLRSVCLINYFFVILAQDMAHSMSSVCLKANVSSNLRPKHCPYEC